MLHLIPLTTAFSTIRSNMLSAHRNLLFRSFDPVWSKDSKRYPFLVMSSNPSTLRYSVPKGSVLGPILFLLYTQPLSKITDRNLVSHSEFAGDSQLYNWVPPEHLRSLISNMLSCIAKVKVWMMQNLLQLNNWKSEAMLIDHQNSQNLPLSIVIGESEINSWSQFRI